MARWKTWRRKFADGIPPAISRRLKLLDRRPAFAQVHFPPEGGSFADLQNHATPAHQRLIFEELFFLEVGLELKRRRMRERLASLLRSRTSARGAEKKSAVSSHGAQKRVLGEIAQDMRHPSPCGDCCRATWARARPSSRCRRPIAIENGYQVALMAPTEILATQHYFSARRMLEDVAGYRILLLTGSLDEDMKRSARRHIAAVTRNWSSGRTR